MSPALPLQINCPQCRAPFTALVHSIIDVGKEPQLKPVLLRGQINLVRCPHCGMTGMLSVPILYHDPQKELLLVFIPPQVGLNAQDRERIIGNMVQALMADTPAEQRRGYFLNPRQMLTMQSLVETILEADGITKEMLEEQAKRVRLLRTLLEVYDNEDKLKAAIEEHRSEIDYPFFVLLSATLEDAMVGGQQELAEQLADLREALLEMTAVPIPEPLPPGSTREDLINALLAAADEETQLGLVLANQPMVDYAFFQALTSRIEAAVSTGQESEAARLRALRDDVLEIAEALERQARAAQEHAAALLREILNSPEPKTAIRQHLGEIDALFLVVLASALQAAEQAKNEPLVAKLRALQEDVRQAIRENMPPEINFVNELLEAEYPAETGKLLREKGGEFGDRLPSLLTALADEIEAHRPETATRLRELHAQLTKIGHPNHGSKP